MLALHSKHSLHSKAVHREAMRREGRFAPFKTLVRNACLLRPSQYSNGAGGKVHTLVAQGKDPAKGEKWRASEADAWWEVGEVKVSFTERFCIFMNGRRRLDNTASTLYN